MGETRKGYFWQEEPQEMLGCPHGTLLGTEEMSLPWEGMGNRALCMALSFDPDTLRDSESPLSLLGEEVVMRAMALAPSVSSSCSLSFMRPPCHSTKGERPFLKIPCEQREIQKPTNLTLSGPNLWGGLGLGPGTRGSVHRLLPFEGCHHRVTD